MEVQPIDDLLDGGWFTTEELAGMLGVDLDPAPLGDRSAPAGTTVRVPVLASDVVQFPRRAALARDPPD